MLRQKFDRPLHVPRRCAAVPCPGCEDNGAKVIDKTDATFSQAGRVSLWTKADSVTYFNRLEVKSVP